MNKGVRGKQVALCASRVQIPSLAANLKRKLQWKSQHNPIGSFNGETLGFKHEDIRYPSV